MASSLASGGIPAGAATAAAEAAMAEGAPTSVVATAAGAAAGAAVSSLGGSPEEAGAAASQGNIRGFHCCLPVRFLTHTLCMHTAALAAGGSEIDGARAAASAARYAAIDQERVPAEVGASAAQAATQAGGDTEVAARAAGFFAGLGACEFFRQRLVRVACLTLSLCIV